MSDDNGQNDNGEDKGKSLFSFVGKALSKLESKRSAAEKLYKSYELETLRKKQQEDGQLPWSIVQYRHILNPSETPLPLPVYNYVTPQSFEKHLRYIASVCNPLPLAELIRLIHFEEEIPDRSVALTFDGGHADFFLNALPLLLRYQVPATLCFPTAYIESNTYLPEDRLLIGLLGLQEMKQPLPTFEFIDAEYYDELKKTSKKLAVTDALIPKFIDILRNFDEETRMRVLHGFATEFGEVLELPDYEDFVRWDDLHKMVELGVTTATMGHSHLIAPKLPPEVFLKDTQRSVEIFSERGLPLEKYFCLPEGVFNDDVLGLIDKIGFLYCLSIGDIPHPKKQKNETKVLGRIAMFDAVSDTEALFACRLWRIRSEQHEF